MSTGIGDELSRLLEAMGLPGSSDERDDLAGFIEDEIRAIGLQASVASIRWGRAVVEADPATIARLEFHRDRIEAAVDIRSEGTVRQLRLRCRRTGGTT